MRALTLTVRTLVAALIVSVAFAIPAAAHCDTMNGPVVSDAKKALKSGDVTPVLKWVKPEHEAEIRDAFARTIKVRAQGPEAKKLADTYFFETLVRIHRAGEGAPYTGLKPAGTEIEPGIAMADAAIQAGKIDRLANTMATDIAENIRQRFAAVERARSHADESLSAGRRYVQAYVSFIHYIERLHQASGGPDEHDISTVAAADSE